MLTNNLIYSSANIIRQYPTPRTTRRNDINTQRRTKQLLLLKTRLGNAPEIHGDGDHQPAPPDNTTANVMPPPAIQANGSNGCPAYAPVWATRTSPVRQIDWRRALTPLILVVTVLLLPGLATAAVTGDGIQVITNPSVSTPSVSRYKLRAIFGMRQPAWPDGEIVRVFVLPDDHPLHRRFAKQRLGVFPYQLRRSWNNLIYSGLGQAPTEVSDEQEMLQWVANTRGAIGYISTGEAHAADTRILPVQ